MTARDSAPGDAVPGGGATDEDLGGHARPRHPRSRSGTETPPMPPGDEGLGNVPDDERGLRPDDEGLGNVRYPPRDGDDQSDPRSRGGR
jgi:hypothetical protein